MGYPAGADVQLPPRGGPIGSVNKECVGKNEKVFDWLAPYLTLSGSG